jgi:hypothetical protein
MPDTVEDLCVILVCLDVPDPPCQQDTGGLSDDDGQPQSGSDTEDEIERLGFFCMLFIVSWLFNSIILNGRMMNWEVCGMELWHISRLISGTGGNCRP